MELLFCAPEKIFLQRGNEFHRQVLARWTWCDAVAMAETRVIFP
jgi:hypothetical protein